MKTFKIILILYELLLGLSALSGGIALIATNGLGMSTADLARTPFENYFWPGIILGLIVGGTHLVAADILVEKGKHAPEALGVAGFGLLIWITTQLYLINNRSWLQIACVVFSIVTLVAAMLLLKFENNSINIDSNN